VYAQLFPLPLLSLKGWLSYGLKRFGISDGYGGGGLTSFTDLDEPPPPPAPPTHLLIFEIVSVTHECYMVYIWN
jgi:hypothetical protein